MNFNFKNLIKKKNLKFKFLNNKGPPPPFKTKTIIKLLNSSNPSTIIIPFHFHHLPPHQ